MPTFPDIRCSSYDLLISTLTEFGWTSRAPTGGEQTANFTAARCDQNHPVIGRMLVPPTGSTVYPVALCNTEHKPSVLNSRAFLMPWPPFYNNTYGG